MRVIQVMTLLRIAVYPQNMSKHRASLHGIQKGIAMAIDPHPDRLTASRKQGPAKDYTAEAWKSVGMLLGESMAAMPVHPATRSTKS